jgi:uncharacterized protein YjbJ (UPF0337 family)
MTGKWLTRWKGRVKRGVGDATGDRRVEATGAIEELAGREPDGRTLERAEQAVREQHGDTRPGGLHEQ